MATGFITAARQESNADNPRFGSGGSYCSNDDMVSREVVFGITDIREDPDNTWEGKPRPRWLLDVIPWYEGESLPGAGADNGRAAQLEAGTVSLACQQTRDQLMQALSRQLSDGIEREGDDFVLGPAVLVKIRVPGGKGGKYLDLREWDEEAEAPMGLTPQEMAEEEPRRPGARQAPARSRGQAQQAAPAPRSARQRAATGAPASEPAPPAEPAGSPGFGAAGGAESDGAPVEPAAVPRPAGATSAPDEPISEISAQDVKLVSDLVGSEPYRDWQELAQEYDLREGLAFPVIGEWLRDHGLRGPGKGRPTEAQRNAYSIALRAWMELTGRNAQGQPYWPEPGADEGNSRDTVETPQDNASRTSPNPAVREGRVAPTGAEHVRQQRQEPQQRDIRPAQVPENAHEADQRLHPSGQQPVRAQDKAAWLPPAEQERRAQGLPAGASEHIYQAGDIGDSAAPCPDCGLTITHRAFPSGGGSYGMMHECPQSGHTHPLQATNIRREPLGTVPTG